MSFWRISISKIFTFFRLRNATDFSYMVHRHNISHPLSSSGMWPFFSPFTERSYGPHLWESGQILWLLLLGTRQSHPVAGTVINWAENFCSWFLKTNWAMKVWQYQINWAVRSLSHQEMPWGEGKGQEPRGTGPGSKETNTSETEPQPPSLLTSHKSGTGHPASPSLSWQIISKIKSLFLDTNLWGNLCPSNR